MTVANNPAGRLLDIFDQLRRIDKQGTFRGLWAAALGHPSKSPEEVTNFAEMATLLREVELAARKVSESGLGYDSESLMYAYPQWAAAVFGWGLSLTPNAKEYVPNNIIPGDSRQALAAVNNVLRAAAREGVLPPDSREAILSRSAETIIEILVQFQAEPRIPEEIRIHLTGKLDGVLESIQNVRFRGDQAVGNKLLAVSASFNAYETSNSNVPDQSMSPLQAQIRSWSSTLRDAAQDFCRALSPPAAVGYFLTTQDALGAGLILAAHPDAIPKATQGLLTRGEVESDSPPS